MIEQQLQEQTKLLKKILAALENGYTPPKAGHPKTVQPSQPEDKRLSVKQPKVTKYDVILALTELRNVRGVQAAKDVLSQFDAKKVPDLKPEQYQGVCDSAKDAV